MIKSYRRLASQMSYKPLLLVDVGYYGGIALFWRSIEVTIEPFILTEQEIYTTIKVSSTTNKWNFSTYTYRKTLWESLRNVATKITSPWLVYGDFNEVTNASEKLGGKPINNTKCSSFIRCLDDMNMIDLGFTGQKYTRTNKHKNNKTLIMERLDHFLSNHDCLSLFPESNVRSSRAHTLITALFS
ncbi:hypothetical protein RDI58_015034 [Solanum bulbocastanum]|uniref:Uncharacterized protein n=1 Tax=Solanum bulbocastanum TaxID=147425 RepID=A0AAN8TEJ4_SOLBU